MDSFCIRQLKSILATILFIAGYICSCFMLFSTFYFHAHHNSIFIVYLPTIFAKRFYNEAFMTWFMYYTALCLDVWTFNNSTIKCDFFLYITKLTQYVLLELNDKFWSLNIFIKFRHFCFWVLQSGCLANKRFKKFMIPIASYLQLNYYFRQSALISNRWSIFYS